MVETTGNVPSSKYCVFGLYNQLYGFNRNIDSLVKLSRACSFLQNLSLYCVLIIYMRLCLRNTPKIPFWQRAVLKRIVIIVIFSNC